MSDCTVEYINDIRSAVSLLRTDEVEAAYRLLDDARRCGRGVYICGNGGSASTASHFAADLGKNICAGPSPRMRVVSLTDNVSWLTALANDNGYTDCFAGQLRNYLQRGDLVIGISASGDSENVVRAFELADERDAQRLALIGFDGGRLAELATQQIYIDSHDYGVVESLHLVVAHLLVRMLSDDQPASPAITTAASDARMQMVGKSHEPLRSDPPLLAGKSDR